MRIRTTVVGVQPRPDVQWPDGWPLPAEGQTVELPTETLYVRHVVWYPVGDGEDGDFEPYVYLVLGTTPVGGFR